MNQFLQNICFPILAILLSIGFQACQEGNANSHTQHQAIAPDTIIYTQYSKGSNPYKGFHSANAINQIADIENQYFNAFPQSISPYYGTIWREYAETGLQADSSSLYDQYVSDLQELGLRPDSMHCTIYAVRALQAGMDATFEELQHYHEQIWGDREHAGWSIGYLLCRYYGWKAYLILDKSSEEYAHCLKAWRKNKSYPVWRQPDIPLAGLFIKGEQDSLFHELLLKNEFGWGFSHQGIHTWITRFDELKECYWAGAPAKKYEAWAGEKKLFLSTPFLQYEDYYSHVVIFPPKKAS